MRRVVIALLRGYQFAISPMFGPTCRFYPSCSSYAIQSVQRHGTLRGGWLAVRRLARCHPWNPGGVDHVPPVRDKSSGSRPDAPSDQTSATQPRPMAEARPPQGA